MVHRRFNLYDNYFVSYERRLYTTSNPPMFALPWPPANRNIINFQLVYRCNRNTENQIMTNN
jgi:hypothetical protein